MISLLWFLIRVIPKPSRITYPCMKATAPLASSFIAYIGGMVASIFVYKKAKMHLRKSRIFMGVFLIFLAVGIGMFAFLHTENQTYAVPSDTFDDPLGPNNPIGEAKGILPGRVVWVHHPDATNENCTNSNHDDAYWLSSNTDQAIVDQMFSEALKSITGEETDAESWDAIFKYFNENHGKGDVGYSDSETIFIKINAVTAHGGAWPDGEISPSRGIEYDTTPQTIMTMLRQLVNQAGVPEENIYIGDPMCDIYNHLYEYFYAEFPNVKYCSKRTIPGRYKMTASTQVGVTYSDHGTVMNQITTHKFFEEMTNADYILNIPTMKGHRWAGVTFFSKNHFGSNTTDGSWQLHKGLMNPDNEGMRYGYKLYRVLVDLMGSKYLGGNTLLYFMDGLWSTSYEHQKPQKFLTAPFNNDWCSSILLSLDPVAVESVCLDILQKEFTEEEIIDGQNGPVPDRWTFVQWDGIDDYLHQAASSDWWPEGITYDPDNSGTPLTSLGVHEHWNNVTNMQYSRDLGTDEGIELIKIFHQGTPVKITIAGNPSTFRLNPNYPNPFNPTTTIQYDLPVNGHVNLTIYDLNGQIVEILVNSEQSTGSYQVVWNAVNIASGMYLVRLNVTGQQNMTQSRRLVLMK